ncbi:hypothetical protein PH586_16730 [Pseudomonas sp. SA3-5]|uniref:DUF2188 domain-containing protein n=1 Tax=Pseudomonas aestuarii TaxID=3018340 RepID=A0ABT4XIL6_9PSED|nr:hypothetical protein [Pseudomonas aestuarii]MDA7088038.1 hypothetical protein [Pseudomonas aestuarii]
MNICIQPLHKAEGTCWQVRFASHSVSFRSETEARQFVATLEARLQAPHPLSSHMQRAAN